MCVCTPTPLSGDTDAESEKLLDIMDNYKME